MEDYKVGKKKQQLGVHKMIENAEKAKVGKGGLHSVVTVNKKKERHGPNEGETVVRMHVQVIVCSTDVSWLGTLKYSCLLL
jgi:hypothetical protein